MPFEVSGFDDYLNKSRQNYVIADPAQRKKLILEEAQKAATEVGGKILYTEDLLDTISFIVEYPVIVRGSFDQDYLKIPKEVLTTTMISHQKYFPVINDEGKLLPYFIAVSNTKARDLAVVARGNERVLRARLADASFFFDEDRKVPLESRVESLKKVVFHTLLGTSHQKVLRFRKLAVKIAQKVKPAVKKNVDRVPRRGDGLGRTRSRAGDRVGAGPGALRGGRARCRRPAARRGPRRPGASAGRRAGDGRRGARGRRGRVRRLHERRPGSATTSTQRSRGASTSWSGAPA